MPAAQHLITQFWATICKTVHLCYRTTITITLSYNIGLSYCETESFKLQQRDFLNKFFKQIRHLENCLHDLLPPKRDPSLSLRLWHCTVYPIPQVKTNRYCALITGSIARSANLPVFSLLRGRLRSFSPHRGDTLHRWG